MRRAIVLFLLAVHAGLLAWQAYRYSPTIDEPAHLVAGLSHWKFGRFDLYRVNPPLVRLVAALPMLIVEPKTDWSAFTEAPYARPEFAIGTAFANANGFDTFWYFTLARWACIPFSLIGGWYSYLWARDLYGSISGLMALTLWCFCPNILGNGTLITPDVGATSLGVAAGYYFWRWLRAPTWTNALLAGLTLGLAELTKSTWIVLFALWPVLWIVWRCCRREKGTEIRVQRPQIRESFFQISVVLALALYILNLGYGFENSSQRLDKFQFISRTLGGPDAHEKPDNRFAGSWLGAIPVPLPANHLLGIDVQKYDFEKGKWSYLRGEQKMGGWWYYYLYAMGVKMPAGTLFLLALTCVLKVTGIKRHLVGGAVPGAELNSANPSRPKTMGTAHPTHCNESPPARSTIHKPHSSVLYPRSSILDEVILLAPAILLITLVSSQTGFNRYLRYVVPAFPFLYIWISQLARQASGGRNQGTVKKAQATSNTQ